MIKKVLVANRGEIASRIFRTCRKMGLSTVGVYSRPDAELPYVYEADEALELDGSTSAETYLDVEKILRAAKISGADAVHPGFGFLSENADFAQACADAGLTFVGPRVEAIRQMGSKDAARQLAKNLGVAVAPGYDGGNTAEFAAHAEKIGYPVLLKAAAGGGGKGMKIVHNPKELAEAVASAQAEARAAFGSDALILEKYLPCARHIEVQIIGDKHGNVGALYERDCSVQRRYQKIIEEAPAPNLHPEIREKIIESALSLARALDYDNAGTVEFVSDGQTYCYFLEVNTRLQVEHPVTEEITGLDLVELQLLSAGGKNIAQKISNPVVRGHAVECRIYAEDPDNDFLPAAGKLRRFFIPEGVRLESGVRTGTEVSAFYDPMLAKVIAFGETRDEALQKMIFALERAVVFGLKTNTDYLIRILKHPTFVRGEHDTSFVKRYGDELRPIHDENTAPAKAALVYRFVQRLKAKHPALVHVPAGWRNNFFAPQFENYKNGQTTLKLEYRSFDDKRLEFTDGTVAQWNDCNDQILVLTLNGVRRRYEILEDEGKIYVHSPGLGTTEWEILPRYDDPATAVATVGDLSSPVPGQVSRILVEGGQTVKTGETLVVVLSMKMEHTVCSPKDGRVEEVFVRPGQFVEAGMPLLEIK